MMDRMDVEGPPDCNLWILYLEAWIPPEWPDDSVSRLK